MKMGDMTDGIFLMHIVDALKETIEFTDGVKKMQSFNISNPVKLKMK